MNTTLSPRPFSSSSRQLSQKQYDLKIVSPQLQSVTPTNFIGLLSPVQSQLARPYSAENISLGSYHINLKELQDEVISDSSFNNTNLLTRSSSSAFQSMKNVLKPKKAQSAQKSQKQKRSPLLIYKETLMSYDGQDKTSDFQLDFSSQYSLIQMKKQIEQIENKQETCPFGQFSAFRKENSSSASGIKRKQSHDSFSSCISKSKFLSKPISIGKPQPPVLISNKKSIDQTRVTNTSYTMRESDGKQCSPKEGKEGIYYLDGEDKQNSKNMCITAQSKRVSKNTYLVAQQTTLTTSKDSNQISKNLNMEITHKNKQNLKTIDSRISLSSVFLINHQQNKDQANKFLHTNYSHLTGVTSTENTARSNYITKNNYFQSETSHFTKSKDKQDNYIKTTLANLQLWPPSSPQNAAFQQNKQEISKISQEFNFISSKPINQHQQITQKRYLTEKAEKEDKQEQDKIIIDSIPDYKFDSNCKTVSNHLEMKAKKIQIQDKQPKTPFIQIHFSQKQEQPIQQKNLEINKLKYCQSANYIGNRILKPQQSAEKFLRKRKSTHKQDVIIENDRLNELRYYIEQDQNEKAAIREKKKQLALLNFSNFSDAKTNEMLDNDVRVEDVFPNASAWIEKSPVSDMIELKFPLVKNYVDKLWSYYKEYEEIQEIDENNEQNVQCSIKVIEEQNHSIQKLYDQINKMNAIFSARFEQSQTTVDKAMIDEFLKINDERLTQQELGIIVAEFTNPYERINYYMVDKILCKLKFFQSFNPHTRMQLLKLGKLVKKEKGEVIFNQGDFGDQMYVILFGSCNVQVKTVSDDGFEMERVVATLYDGVNLFSFIPILILLLFIYLFIHSFIQKQQFGELAMMKTTTKKQKQSNVEQNLKEKKLKDIKIKMKKYEIMTQLERNYQRKGIKKSRSQIELECEKIQNKQKQENQDDESDKFNELDEQNQIKKQKGEVLERTRRAATIQLIEDSYLIIISKTDFQEVLMGLMQAELDNKIKLLSSIHLFDMFQPFALIPLANLMKVKRYAVNDLVVEQGKLLKYFYIVSKGRFKVLRIEKTERQIKKDTKPKPMVFSIMKYKENEVEKKEKENQKTKLQEIEQKPVYEDYESSSFDDDIQDDEQPERLLRDPKLANTEKIFDYQKCSRPDQNIVYYKKFVEYDSFSQGDYFGGRVLTGKNPDLNQAGYALKTVIADTNECELYVLEKIQLQYLPQFIKEWLIIGLEQIQEFDDINKKVESQNNKNWESLKEQIHQRTVKQINLQKFVEKAKLW